MTEKEAAVSNEEITVSEGTRIILRKNMDLPVAEVVKAVKDLVGKAPSTVLVYQIKRKLKNTSVKKATKALKKASVKETKVTNEVHPFEEIKELNLSHEENTLSTEDYTKVAAKLTKIRKYIKEFGGKDSLIGWANLA